MVVDRADERAHRGGAIAIVFRRGSPVDRAHREGVRHHGFRRVHVAPGDHQALAAPAGRPGAGPCGHRQHIAIIIEAHHVEAAGVMAIGVASPRAQSVGRLVSVQFRGALHDRQHVLIGDVEHLSHLPAGGRERAAVHRQPVGVGVHVVERADQASVRCEDRRALDDVEPLVVGMLLQHGRGADRRRARRGLGAEMHREHLVTRLSAVLHQQQWLMAGGPVHRGDIFIVLAVPGDLLDAQSRILVVPVVRELRQRQAHIGVAGERTRVSTAGGRRLRVRRVADVPHRLRCRVERLEDDVTGVRPPPEAVVTVHLLAGDEFGQTDLPRVLVGVIVRIHAPQRAELVGGGVVGGARLLVAAAVAVRVRRRLAVAVVVGGIIMTTVRRPLRRDVDQHQMFAGRVRHMPAVRRYARIKHRRGTLSCGDAIRRQHTGATAAVFGDLGQEQLTVDREDHTAASRIHRIRDNARAAFTGALATDLLLGRHVLVISVRKQHTRVGQQHLPMCAVRVEHAQPQRGHQVLRAVGTQEQRAGTVANRGRGTRGAAGEPQRLRLVAGKIADCIMKSRHIVHAHHGSHRTGQTTPAALPLASP